MNRFEWRSSMKKEENDSIILTLEDLYMNDSGIFYCSDGRLDSPKIKVSVKPGYQNEIVAEYSKKPQGRHWRVNLTCNSCANKTLVKTDGNDTITWKLNGKDVPKRIIIQKLKNIIQITNNPRHSHGLWECSDQACPGQSDGYCLESVPGTSEEFGNKETYFFSTKSPGTKKGEVDPRVIGGCVAGLLALLLVGVVVFVTCRRRSSHNTSPSDTTKEQEAQGSKPSTEGSPKRRNKEDSGTANPTSTEHEAAGIQYSMLQFRETGGHQNQMDKEMVIYAEMPANT
ncbi:uncharacterized protein LOC134396901 isoform X2 [Elgaria multicarinata webbii]|uniref:uncharacterized protein LOC134396901 isoform X2 n=1 Tax=Elgaria multicarinata webbii TaxID=159646 RepID=UPI002FCD13B9